jgi:hypothetical protein
VLDLRKALHDSVQGCVVQDEESDIPYGRQAMVLPLLLSGGPEHSGPSLSIAAMPLYCSDLM